MFRKTAAVIIFLLVAATIAWSAKTTFIDGDPNTGIKGTRVYASFLNALNTHYHDGIATDGHGALPYAAASGTNNYVLTLSPALQSYVTGMPLYFTVSNANTSVCTININGLGTRSIKKEVTSSLVSGDIPAYKMVEIRYDGTNFQLINPTNTIGNVAGNVSGSSASCTGNSATATTATNATNILSPIPSRWIKLYTIIEGEQAVAAGTSVEIVGMSNGEPCFYSAHAKFGAADVLLSQNSGSGLSAYMVEKTTGAKVLVLSNTTGTTRTFVYKIYRFADSV